MEEEIYKLIKLTPVFNSKPAFSFLIISISNREDWKNAQANQEEDQEKKDSCKKKQERGDQNTMMKQISRFDLPNL